MSFINIFENIRWIIFKVFDYRHLNWQNISLSVFIYITCISTYGTYKIHTDSISMKVWKFEWLYEIEEVKKNIFPFVKFSTWFFQPAFYLFSFPSIFLFLFCFVRQMIKLPTRTGCRISLIVNKNSVEKSLETYIY